MSEGPRSKRDALDQVSDELANKLRTMDLTDFFGYTPEFTAAQRERWDTAVREVEKKLREMGKKRPGTRNVDPARLFGKAGG